MLTNRWILLLVSLVALLLVTDLFAQPALAAIDDKATYYAVDGNGTLFLIDKATGQSTVIGETGQILTDVAITPKGEELYGVSLDSVYRVDPVTAAATLVGVIGVAGVNALGFNSTGALYAATLNGELLTIDKTTGIGTIVGHFGEGIYYSSGDIVFNSRDELYAVIKGKPSKSDRLAKVNLATGAATIIGSIGYESVWGLTVDPQDNLYGGVSLLEPLLIAINKATGAGSLIGVIPAAQELHGLTTAFSDRPANHFAVAADTGWGYPVNDLCDALDQCRSPLQSVSDGFMAYYVPTAQFNYGQDFTGNQEITTSYAPGDSVYAMAKGRIVKVRRVEKYGGDGYNAILVEYKYYDKKGKVKPVYVMYGQVQNIKNAPPYTGVKEKSVKIKVLRYEKIAELNDPSAAGGSPQLHLAVMPGRWNSVTQTYTYPAKWYQYYANTQEKNGRARPFDLWTNSNGSSDWTDAGGLQPLDQDRVFFDTFKPCL